MSSMALLFMTSYNFFWFTKIIKRIDSMRHCCHNFEIFIIFLRLLLLFYSYFCAVKEIEHEIDSRQWKHED